MSRPYQITVAAILLFLLSLLNTMSELPALLQGPAGADSLNDIGTYSWTLFNFAYSVAGVIAAFGLWRNMRWGRVLALVSSALSILNLLVGLLSGQLELFPIVMASIFTILYLVVIVLVLRHAQVTVESSL